MTRSLEVTVSAGCVSSGYCRNVAPTIFGTGPERRTVVLIHPVEHSHELQEAMESCPVEAISARDAATGEGVFPEA